MISYVTIGTDDIGKAVAFYDPVMAALGHARTFMDGGWAGYAPKDDLEHAKVLLCAKQEQTNTGLDARCDGAKSTFKGTFLTPITTSGDASGKQQADMKACPSKTFRKSRLTAWRMSAGSAAVSQACRKSCAASAVNSAALVPCPVASASQKMVRPDSPGLQPKTSPPISVTGW